jgi:hypothetical protein
MEWELQRYTDRIIPVALGVRRRLHLVLSQRGVWGFSDLACCNSQNEWICTLIACMPSCTVFNFLVCQPTVQSNSSIGSIRAEQCHRCSVCRHSKVTPSHSTMLRHGRRWSARGGRRASAGRQSTRRQPAPGSDPGRPATTPTRTPFHPSIRWSPPQGVLGRATRLLQVPCVGVAWDALICFPLTGSGALNYLPSATRQTPARRDGTTTAEIPLGLQQPPFSHSARCR